MVYMNSVKVVINQTSKGVVLWKSVKTVTRILHLPMSHKMFGFIIGCNITTPPTKMHVNFKYTNTPNSNLYKCIISVSARQINHLNNTGPYVAIKTD